MRAIIINDNDARSLLDQLRLESFKGIASCPLADNLNLQPEQLGLVVNEIHRKFHFIVSQWLQEQGASLIR
jgi:hypothetical protein